MFGIVNAYPIGAQDLMMEIMVKIMMLMVQMFCMEFAASI